MNFKYLYYQYTCTCLLNHKLLKPKINDLFSVFIISLSQSLVNF